MPPLDSSTLPCTSMPASFSLISLLALISPSRNEAASRGRGRGEPYGGVTLHGCPGPAIPLPPDWDYFLTFAPSRRRGALTDGAALVWYTPPWLSSRAETPWSIDILVERGRRCRRGGGHDRRHRNHAPWQGTSCARGGRRGLAGLGCPLFAAVRRRRRARSHAIRGLQLRR